MIFKSTKIYGLDDYQYAIKIVWDIRVDCRKYLFVEYRDWEDSRVDCWLEYPSDLDNESYEFFFNWFSEVTENRDYTMYGDYCDKKYDKTSDIEDFQNNDIPEDMLYEIEDGHIARYDY